MIDFTDKELRELERKGAKVRRKKKLKNTTAPVNVAPKPQQAPQPVDTDSLAAAVSARTLAGVTDALTRAVKQIGDQRKPSAYRFVVNRDKDGNMVSVDAEPVG